MCKQAGAVSLPRGEPSRNSLQGSHLLSRIGRRGHSGVLLAAFLRLQDAPGQAQTCVIGTA